MNNISGKEHSCEPVGPVNSQLQYVFKGAHRNRNNSENDEESGQTCLLSHSCSKLDSALNNKSQRFVVNPMELKDNDEIRLSLKQESNLVINTSRSLVKSTPNENFCSKSFSTSVENNIVTTENSNSKADIHYTNPIMNYGAIKDQPIVVTPKSLMSEITQTTAKVSIGNTTISVPLLKPVSSTKFVQDVCGIQKNQLKSKTHDLQSQQQRKLVSHINNKHSSILNVKRGQKFNPPTIVSLSQLQIKPSNNAKIVQATVVSNKLKVQQSSDALKHSSINVSSITAKTNLTQKYCYPKQVGNHVSYFHKESEEEQTSQKNVRSKHTNFLKEKEICEKFEGNEHFKNQSNIENCFSAQEFPITSTTADSVFFSSKCTDSISFPRQKLETVKTIDLENSPSMPTLLSKELKTESSEVILDTKSSSKDIVTDLIARSTLGATLSNISPVFAMSTAPITQRIGTSPVAVSCTSKRSFNSNFNIPGSLSLIVSQNTGSHTTTTSLSTTSNNSNQSRLVTDEITKKVQFPKVITLKKTGYSSKRDNVTPIQVMCVPNQSQNSGLIELQCNQRSREIGLKTESQGPDLSSEFREESEHLHPITRHTIVGENYTEAFISTTKRQQHLAETIEEKTHLTTLDDSVMTCDYNTCNQFLDARVSDQHMFSAEIPSPKMEDSQNILLKQLLKNSTLNTNQTAANNSSAPSSVCSQVLTSRKIINIRAPSLGLVSSLEAQLARPVIPPVPTPPAIITSVCAVEEPLNNENECNKTNGRTNKPMQIITRETSFVSNPKHCSNTTQGTSDGLSEHIDKMPSFNANTKNLVTHVSNSILSPSICRDSAVSSCSNLNKPQSTDQRFNKIDFKIVKSDQKIFSNTDEANVKCLQQINKINASTAEPNIYNVKCKKSIEVVSGSNILRMPFSKDSLSLEAEKEVSLSNVTQLPNKATKYVKDSSRAVKGLFSKEISENKPNYLNSEADKQTSNTDKLLSCSQGCADIDEGVTETKQRKKRKREPQSLPISFNNNEDKPNDAEFTNTKKRPRKMSKSEEDYDVYMDNMVNQMKQMAALDILEPLICQNIAICSYRSNDPTKLFNKKELENADKNKMANEKNSQRFTEILDFYEEQPFGYLKSFTKNNFLNMQNDFYDQEFSTHMCDYNKKKISKLLNTLKCRNLDLTENICVKSSAKLGSIQVDMQLSHKNYPGLVSKKDGSRFIGRQSPTIPFIKPVWLKLISTPASLRHPSNSEIFNGINDDSKMKAEIRKLPMLPTSDDDQTNLTVLLTLSSVEVEGVLKDLANILNISAISSYKLLEDTAGPCLSYFQKGYYKKGTQRKNFHNSYIQNILNGSKKLCQSCGFSGFKLEIRMPLNNFQHLLKKEYNILKPSSSYIYFCNSACFANFKGKSFCGSTQFNVNDSIQKTRQKSMSIVLKSKGSHLTKNKRCRYKYFNINCFPTRVPSKPIIQTEVSDIMFDFNLTLSSNNTSNKKNWNKENTRQCNLCNHKGDGVSDGTSRLLNFDVEKWVHLNCALWSNGVYETISGGLVNVETALKNGRSQECCYCHQLGATIKCFKNRCDHLFHLLCAKKGQSVFYKNKTIHCQTHNTKVGRDNELSSLQVKRRVFVERDESHQVANFMQHHDLNNFLRVGSVIFLNVGHLLPHQLEAFHTTNYIYPVGYKAVRFYWSMKKPNQRCRYVCTIEEVENRPEFIVHVQDNNGSYFEVRDLTPNAVWLRILEPISALKKQQANLNIFPKFLSGDDLFGLNEPSIVRILESLPGVESLNDYRFKFGRNPLLELPVHSTGAARTEPLQRQVLGSKKPHTQRTATTTNQRLSTSMVVGEVACPYSKQFVHSKSSQYKKMNQEWRNNVYLARSKIQGLGLYAARDLEKHTMVIEYIGEVIRTEVSEIREKQYEAKNRGIYMFRLDEERVVDATLSGGLARYINHSCNPNCVTEIVDVERELRIIIFAKRRISRGEELSYDYKFDIEDEAHKLPCMCGSSNCRKQMN